MKRYAHLMGMDLWCNMRGGKHVLWIQIGSFFIQQNGIDEPLAPIPYVHVYSMF